MGWIQTKSGIAFDLHNPQPNQIRIGDIAYALSHTRRFTGHAGGYSVAQHCVLVSRILPPGLKFAGLMHDAAEAYLNDIATPAKNDLPEYKAMEDVIWCAIAKKYGLPEVLPEAVKFADITLLMTERRDLMSKPPMPWDARFEAVMPLKRRIWRWPAWYARWQFKRAFKRLYGYCDSQMSDWPGP